MIVALSKDSTPREKEAVLSYLSDNGFSVREQHLGGDALLLAGAPGGGIPAVSERELSLLPGVARVAQTSKPYQLAARETKGTDTIITVAASGGANAGGRPGGVSSGGVTAGGAYAVQIGGARICVIAGPCAVESKEQIAETAACVRESGAVILRGGAYKPRTSPYAFQGLGMKGLEYMKAAGEAQGMPIVTEVVSPELVEDMKDLTDIFQIGARNMQNFELLKRAGALGKPVLLKRGASATIEEWLLAAEYLLAAGSKDVMLCERGIRTFETYTRNTLDISAIPVLKGLSHLPVIVDPSHAVGIRDMVPRAALAAIAAGADGLTVEVHPKPEKALSDGPQSLYPEQFERLMRDIEALAPVVGKELLRLPRPETGGQKPKNAANAHWAEAFSLVTEKIAFCGESGAYAEQALDRAFGENAPRLPLPSFPAVFDAVLDGSAVFGIVPVENSLTGTIHENYDLFTRYPDVAITGELKLRIVHCLIAAAGASFDTIRAVRSHSQGFAQCKEFLDKHPQWRFETWNNTAAAVHSIAGDGQAPDITTAAIASEAAAKVYGLTALKTGIETNPQNYTRFAVIARRRGGTAAVSFRENSAFGQPDKASLVFSIKDETGSLYPCLQILNKYGINMTKLESRPILGQPWSYMFYVDITVKEPDTLETALFELKNQTENLLFLGVYRAAA